MWDRGEIERGGWMSIISKWRIVDPTINRMGKDGSRKVYTWWKFVFERDI